MLNYKHKMTEKVEEDAQKLEALFKILNEENELNNINIIEISYISCSFYLYNNHMLIEFHKILYRNIKYFFKN